MKISIRSIFLLIVISLSGSIYGFEKIYIITEEWAPYNYLENGRITGFSTEIVQAMQEELGLNVEITLLPSMRTTYTLKHQPRTMMFSMFRTPERERMYKWIGPLSDASVYFYKRKTDPREFPSLGHLKRVKLISCRQGGLIPNLLMEMGFQNLDMTSNTSPSIYRKIIDERCDLGISDSDLGARYHLKQLGYSFDDELEKIDISIFAGDLYIACSKDITDSEILQWQSALDTIKSNGIYDSILMKYK